MITISATEVKQKFGEHVTNAVVEPIVVEKFGRPLVVMLSYAEYKRLQALEDRYWGEMARTAEEEGYASSEEAKEFQAKLAAGLRARE